MTKMDAAIALARKAVGTLSTIRVLIGPVGRNSRNILPHVRRSTTRTSRKPISEPPTSQDKIFGNNFDLDPERVSGFDAGLTQNFWGGRITAGATYFHNDLSNVIGLNGLFETVNLGAARTQGIQTELQARPMANLSLTTSYTYLDTEKTSSADISQLPDARLPRRPRNEFYVSASYLWFGKLRTTAEAKWVNARERENFGFANIDLEDYSFANFAAEYQVNSHLTIFGRVDNLTNEHYSEVFGFPALGRAAYGGFKVLF